MTGAYLWAVALHVVAATLWIGGMLFFAVAAPVLRSVEDDAVRARLFDAMGRRFRLVGWICVSTLLATGLVQLRLRGWWGQAFWNPSSLAGTPIGLALIWKLGLVATMVVVQGVHDFWLGPRAGRATPGSEQARVARVRAAGLARVNAVVALLLVYVAVRLGRGG